MKTKFLNELDGIAKSPLKSTLGNTLQMISLSAYTAKNYLVPLAVDSAKEAYQAIESLEEDISASNSNNEIIKGL